MTNRVSLIAHKYSIENYTNEFWHINHNICDRFCNRNVIEFSIIFDMIKRTQAVIRLFHGQSISQLENIISINNCHGFD